MRTLEKIQSDVNLGSQEVLTDDGRITSELLWEILQRIDKLMFAQLSEIEVLDNITQVDITTVETLIYMNNTDKPVTLKIYNTDPAQTVHIGKTGVTITGPGAPIFHESSMKLTIDAGDAVYGIVELGTVDIRYSRFLFQ